MMTINRRRVCVLSSAHRPFDGRIFYKEALTLVNAGYDISLIIQHTQDEIIDGIKIIALPKPKNKVERLLKLGYLTYKKALEQKAHIYHFHDPELLPWMIRLRKKTQAYIIYDVHEDVPRQILSKEYIPKCFKRILSLIIEILEDFWISRLNFIITSTDFIKDRLVKYNYNTVSVKNYVSVHYVALKEWQANSNIFRIIFSGGIYQERGLLEGVKAVNLINRSSIEFLLYGPVEEKFLAELYKADQHKRIKYNGILSYVDMLNKTKEADVGFICDYPLKRHMEGLPVKLFEYMAAGIPVICSNFPLWREIVEKNKCGICVNPLGIKEIAWAINYLIKNPQEAKKMGENGQRAILEQYNWENESKKLLNIYNNLLKD